MVVSVRPENIEIHKQKPASSDNVIEARVEGVMFLGDFLDCQILAKGKLVRVKLHPTSLVEEREEVFMKFVPRLCTVIPVD